MRSLNNSRCALLSRGIVTICLATGLASCGTIGGGSSDSRLARASSAPVANGPRADYPITIGEPYMVNGIEYVPSDSMNYDHVGYLAMDAGAMGYTGSHHTLPIPSYVEVTSLETGRTILVRLERRGPMTSNELLGLSPAAMTQLGANAETPVRVRRVNPPEDHRFMLRAGDAAPLRMDTPASLLTVLQRRVPASGAASLRASSDPRTSAGTVETVELARSEVPSAPAPVSAPAPAPSPLPELAPAAAPAPVPAPTPASSTPPPLPPLEPVAAAPRRSAEAEGSFAAAFDETPRPAASPISAPPPIEREAAEGRFVVQAAAFSTRDRADRVANVIGGVVTQAGAYYRVRTGPFTTRGEAEASLANVRRAGYTDARILTSG